MGFQRAVRNIVLTTFSILAATIALPAWSQTPGPFTGEYFRPALVEALKELEKAASPARALSALQKMGGLASETGNPPWLEARLVSWVQGGGDPLVSPAVRDYLAREYLRKGDLDRAREILAPLGLIDTWFLQGPHPNSDAQGAPLDHPWSPEIDLKTLLKGGSSQFHQIARPKQRSGLLLSPFLWPDEDITVYLMASLQASKAGPAALRMGSLGSYKTWLNGKEVGKFSGVRPERIDQDAWGVHLRKGLNVLLVKVIVKDRGGKIHARFTQVDGSALDLKHLHSIPKSIGKAKSGQAVLPRTFFSSNTNNNSDAMTLDEALGHIALGDLSEEDTRPKEALSKFSENNPNNIEFLYLRARQETSTTAYYQYMEAAAAKGSTQAQFSMARYRGNWGNPLVKAFEVKALLKKYPKDPIFLAEYQLVRARTQESSRAQHQLRALAETHKDVAGVVDAYHSALGSSERYIRYMEVGEQILAMDQTRSGLRNDLAQNLWVQGDPDQALNLIDSGLKLFPMSASLARSKADLLSGSGRYMEAMEIWDKILERCPTHFEALREKGHCLIALKRDKEGRSMLRASLDNLPQQMVLKRYLDRLEDAPPVPGQRALWVNGDAPEAVTRKNDEEAVVLLDHQIVEVFESGLTEKTFEKAVQVFGEGGVNQFRSIAMGHDPLRESLRVLRMEIHRPDGTVIPGRLRRGGRVSDRANNLYYDFVASYITFPDLRKGDRIYYRYVIRDTETRNSYGKYFGMMDFFGVSHRTLKRGLEIWMPKDRQLFHKTVHMNLDPEIESIEQWRVYKWQAEKLSLKHREAFMPGIGDTVPYVHVATYRDWTELGQWYQNFIQSQIHLGEAEARRARSMVSEATTTTEKVAILHDYVVKKTRYVGLEFGVHGYLPYSCQTVLTRGFGDCKDKANLMVSLLQEVGVDAHMVLIRTRHLGAIETEPASLSVFNHAIAYVPELDLFLDGTAEHSGMSELPWQDQGAEVLIVPREAKPYLATTPIFPYEHNLGHHRFTLKIDDQGDAQGSLRMELRGGAVASLRKAYLSQDKRQEKLTQWLGRRFPGASSDQVKTSDPEDLSVDFTLTAETINLPGFGRREAGALRLPVSIRQPEMGGTYTSLSNRKQALNLGAPYQHVETLEMELPPGQFSSPLEPVHLNTPYGSLDVVYRLDSRTLTTEVDLKIFKYQISAEDYQAFADFARAVDRALEPHLFYQLEAPQ